MKKMEKKAMKNMDNVYNGPLALSMEIGMMEAVRANVNGSSSDPIEWVETAIQRKKEGR